MVIPLNDDNPIGVVPWVTYGLIGANILIFLWQMTLGDQSEPIIYGLGFIPSTMFGNRSLPPELVLLPPAATLVSSQFLHGGFMHLAGNMLFLWVFGNNIEDALGSVRFLVFYLVCGASAAVGQGLIDPNSTLPMIGASGAISGVLGAYLMLYPFARILVVIPLGFILYPTRLSAVWVLGGWFLLQFIAALLSSPGTPGIAFWAHFAGFLAGVLLVLFMRRRDVPLFGKVGVIPKGPWARALHQSPHPGRRSWHD